MIISRPSSSITSPRKVKLARRNIASPFPPINHSFFFSLPCSFNLLNAVDTRTQHILPAQTDAMWPGGAAGSWDGAAASGDNSWVEQPAATSGDNFSGGDAFTGIDAEHVSKHEGAGGSGYTCRKYVLLLFSDVALTNIIAAATS